MKKTKNKKITFMNCMTLTRKPFGRFGQLMNALKKFALINVLRKMKMRRTTCFLSGAWLNCGYSSFYG